MSFSQKTIWGIEYFGGCGKFCETRRNREVPHRSSHHAVTPLTDTGNNVRSNVIFSSGTDLCFWFGIKGSSFPFSIILHKFLESFKPVEKTTTNCCKN